jgi:hypothetical protein
MRAKILFITIVLFANTASARELDFKKNKPKRIRHEDAQETCLITLGASISDKLLKECISSVMKTGKVATRLLKTRK